MECFKKKLLFFIIFFLVLNIEYGFGQQSVENNQFYISAKAQDNPTNRSLGTKFNIEVLNKSDHSTAVFSLKKFGFNEITHLAIGGKKLLIVGPNDYEGKLITDFYVLDLENKKVSGDHMLNAAVSPDGEKVVFDQFRPIHFRDWDNDTSAINMLEVNENGIDVFPVFPRDAVLDVDNPKRCELVSNILWSSDNKKIVFLVGFDGDVDNVDQIVVIDLSGGHQFKIAVKGILKSFLKTIAKNDAPKDINELADSFAIKPDTFQWHQGNQSIEFRVWSNGIFKDEPIILDLPNRFESVSK